MFYLFSEYAFNYYNEESFVKSYINSERYALNLLLLDCIDLDGVSGILNSWTDEEAQYEIGQHRQQLAVEAKADELERLELAELEDKYSDWLNRGEFNEVLEWESEEEERFDWMLSDAHDRALCDLGDEHGGFSWDCTRIEAVDYVNNIARYSSHCVSRVIVVSAGDTDMHCDVLAA